MPDFKGYSAAMHMVIWALSIISRISQTHLAHCGRVWQ
jgi:hypothetical protein